MGNKQDCSQDSLLSLNIALKIWDSNFSADSFSGQITGKHVSLITCDEQSYSLLDLSVSN